MCEMYGTKLTSNYGDVAPQMWKVTINGFKDHELARGLRKLMYKGSGTPPTLPQFVAACKYTDEEDQPIQTDKPLLEKPEYKEPVWSHAQKTMLAYLWKNTVPSEFIPEMTQIKNRMVEDFRRILSEDESLSGAEIRDALFSAWDKARNAQKR